MCPANRGKPTNRLAIRAVRKLFRSEAHSTFEDERIGLTIEHRTFEACSVLSLMSALQLAMLVVSRSKLYRTEPKAVATLQGRSFI